MTNDLQEVRIPMEGSNTVESAWSFSFSVKVGFEEVNSSLLTG